MKSYEITLSELDRDKVSFDQGDIMVNLCTLTISRMTWEKMGRPHRVKVTVSPREEDE